MADNWRHAAPCAWEGPVGQCPATGPLKRTPAHARGPGQRESLNRARVFRDANTGRADKPRHGTGVRSAVARLAGI